MDGAVTFLLVILGLTLITAIVLFSLYWGRRVNNPDCNCQNSDCNCDVCPLPNISETGCPSKTPGGSQVAGSCTGDCTTCCNESTGTGSFGCDNSCYCTGGQQAGGSGSAYFYSSSAPCSASIDTCVDNDDLVTAASGYPCSTATAVKGCDFQTEAGPLLGELCPVSCNLCGTPSMGSQIPAGSKTSGVSAKPFMPSKTPTVSNGCPQGNCPSNTPINYPMSGAACTGNPDFDNLSYNIGTGAGCSADPQVCMDNNLLVKQGSSSDLVTDCQSLLAFYGCDDATDNMKEKGFTVRDYCPATCQSETCPAFRTASTGPTGTSVVPTGPSSMPSKVGVDYYDNSSFCTGGQQADGSGSAYFYSDGAQCSAEQGACSNNDALVQAAKGVDCSLAVQFAADGCATVTDAGPVLSDLCPAECGTCGGTEGFFVPGKKKMRRKAKHMVGVYEGMSGTCYCGIPGSPPDFVGSFDVSDCTECTDKACASNFPGVGAKSMDCQ